MIKSERTSQALTIAIDGLDGAGKTTQLRLLAAYFREKGLHVHATRASGGTPISAALREVSLSPHPRSAETDLYISYAMFTSLAEDLAEKRKTAPIILIDRSPLTIVAYNGYGSQMPNKQRAITACDHFILTWNIDIILYLDAPTDLLTSRRQHRHKQTDYFEEQGSDYLERVHEGYEAAIKHVISRPDLQTKIIRIDASADIDSIHHSIIKKLST